MAQPTITSVTPNFGSNIGNTFITITGTNLSGATLVTFGGVTATVTVNTPTQIVAVVPQVCLVPVGLVNLSPQALDQFGNAMDPDVINWSITFNGACTVLDWPCQILIPKAGTYAVTATGTYTLVNPAIVQRCDFILIAK